jgi:hypothetical protein
MVLISGILMACYQIFLASKMKPIISNYYSFQLHKGKLFSVMEDVKFLSAQVPHAVSIFICTSSAKNPCKLCATLDTFHFHI